MKKIRFGSISKKPKIYNIAVISAILLLIVVLGTLVGERMMLPVYISFTVYYILVIVFLVDAFIKQLNYNPYSYNSVFYIGFAVFAAVTLIVHLLGFSSVFNTSESYYEEAAVRYLLSSASSFMFVSTPAIILFSIGLFVSNVALIRHERFRLANVLGIILSLMMTGGLVVLFLYDMYATGSVYEVMAHDIIGNIGSAIYLYVESMLIGIIVMGAYVSRYEPPKDKDYIIVLGCGIRKDGTPTPLLRGRVDRAISFYREQFVKTGKKAVFVVSGGKGPDEVISEAECMKNYLMSKGIPEEIIIMEDKSSSTEENMRFSKEKIMEAGYSDNIAFATTNYHVFRSGLKARRVKMKADGMGAPTKWYFWPNAAVREFVGLLTEHKLKQFIIIMSMVVVYVALTVFYYMRITQMFAS